MSRRDLHRLSEPAAAPAPRKGAHVRQARAVAQGSQGTRMGGDSSSSLGMPSGEGPVRPRGLSVQLTPTRDHLHQVFIARHLGLLAFLILFTWYRLKQSAPVSYLEFSMQIVADVLLLTAALYLSGGEASPFNDLYFVPLVIAAATLPLTHTLIVAFTIVGCHWFACVYYAPPTGLLKPDDDMVE